MAQSDITPNIGVNIESEEISITAVIGSNITAAINNVVTAESRGQVTAVGTVTAETKGTITAQMQGGTATTLRSATNSWMLSANNAIGTGSALGILAGNFAYIMTWASGNSASAQLLASIDSATWANVTSWSLGASQTATAQITGYFPYLAGQVSWVSADGAASGTVWMRGAGVK